MPVTPATATLKQPIKVGSIELTNRVVAAPICGASKIPFRTLARRYGADVSYTEMVKAYPLVRGNSSGKRLGSDKKTLDLLKTIADEQPVGPQICGADEAIMADASRKLEQMGFPLIDINMGCPVPKVIREGAGAALLKDPAKVEAIVRACASAVSIPVTVKIRSGWDGQSFTGPDVARAAEQGGAKLITIHARKRAQFHSGEVDHAAIGLVKQSVSIPIVGNGGVEDAPSALRMLRESGCDAVMVGRGCFGRPWVFREIAAAIRGDAAPPPPTIDELGEVLHWHLRRTHEVDPIRGNGLSRKYVTWYMHGVPYGTFFRDRAFRAQSQAEMTALVDEFIVHAKACVGISPHSSELPIPPFVRELMSKGVVSRDVSPHAARSVDDDATTCEEG